MFNNNVLDVVIGLVFIFLLYSLMATTIHEIIANYLSLRGKMLYKGIGRMLEDGSGKVDFLNKFYNHPSIKYLSENDSFKKPSYLQASTFAQTLIYLFRGDNYTNAQNQMDAIKKTLSDNTHGIAGETIQHLKNLYEDAQGDVDRFKSKLEQWFNDTMERTSGWYKKQTQWILLAIGFAIAIAGNVDTIHIYNVLAKDKAAREQIVNMAIQSQQKYATGVSEISKLSRDSFKINNKDTTHYKMMILTTGDSLLDSTYKKVSEDEKRASTILGLGWSNTCFCKALFSKAFFGWLLTALAISFGAPFWFDLLNKFINLRNAGAKPIPPKNSSGGNDGSADPLPTKKVG